MWMRMWNEVRKNTCSEIAMCSDLTVHIQRWKGCIEATITSKFIGDNDSL